MGKHPGQAQPTRRSTKPGAGSQNAASVPLRHSHNPTHRPPNSAPAPGGEQRGTRLDMEAKLQSSIFGIFVTCVLRSMRVRVGFDRKGNRLQAGTHRAQGDTNGERVRRSTHAGGVGERKIKEATGSRGTATTTTTTTAAAAAGQGKKPLRAAQPHTKYTIEKKTRTHSTPSPRERRPKRGNTRGGAEGGDQKRKREQQRPRATGRDATQTSHNTSQCGRLCVLRVICCVALSHTS